MTQGKALPPEVVNQIVARTDGVPLFIEELTKTVLESGLLREAGNRYELTGPLPPLAIPSTLHASLVARLDRLASVKDVAQIGAVIGREFTYSLIAAVSALPERDLQAAIAQLITAEMIFGRGVPPEATYIFKHALVQDAAYASLVRSRRQQLHALVAHALEQRFAAIAATEPEIVAHHFTQAGVPDAAIAYWLQAGGRATSCSANREAIGHLTNGLTLLKDVPDTFKRDQLEFKLQVAIIPALMATKGYAATEAEHAATRAWDLSKRVSDNPDHFHVLWNLWLVQLVRANHRTALELGQQLLGLADNAGDQAFRLEAQMAVGITSLHLGELRIAHEYFGKSVALYDPERHRGLAFEFGGVDPAGASLGFNSWTLQCLGHTDQALANCERGLALVGQLGQPYSLARALYYSAILHQLRRKFGVAQERMTAAEEMAAQHGFGILLGLAPIMRGWALVEGGDVTGGIDEMHRGLETYRATNAGFQRPYFLALLAGVYKASGQPQNGLTLVAEAIALAEKTEERYFEAELYQLKGQLLLAQSPQNSAEAQPVIIERSTSPAISTQDYGSFAPLRAWHSSGAMKENRSRPATS